MNAPDELKYSKDHEWVKAEGGIAAVGITDFAQHQLTDVVFVELPEVGASAEAGKPIAAVESVKAVSDVYAPVSGEVIEVNDALRDAPELINTDPYGEGWIFKLKMSDPSAADALMNAEQYKEHAASESH